MVPVLTGGQMDDMQINNLTDVNNYFSRIKWSYRDHADSWKMKLL